MEEYSDTTPKDIARYPMVPIRDVVIFPSTKVAFKIGRPGSVRALEKALATDRMIFLATQHDASIDEPRPEQIYRVGTVARILQAQRQENGQIKVVVEGRERATTIRVENEDGAFTAIVRRAPIATETGLRVESLIQRIAQLLEQHMRLAPEMPTDALQAALRNPDPAQMSDQFASQMRISVEDKQGLLEIFSVHERLQRIVELLEIEVEKRQIDRTIQNRVKRQMEKAQREYYLNEQIKAIHKELGRKDEKAELDELRKKIEEAGMSAEAKEKALQELNRLEAMPPMSAEGTVSRTYIDWLLSVPWKQESKEVRDLQKAEEVLNEDHYGLEKIKERILEYLAVRQLVKNPKGSILCFVGPPGVGKTSLGKSIARATGRKFVRLSLGGVRDEAEIRGHRRTYIGALPGQIIQMMKKAGTINPVMLLDEVDKLGTDFRGDPAAALLEVLDPEQNHAFHDHYLDVDYDLSKVFFIATANVLHTIPPALQDRLEILRLSGYTEREKLEIARRHLIPKQAEANGLKPNQIEFTEDGILEIIRHYTREAGVRNLEREIGSCCRKVARKLVAQKAGPNFKEVIDAERVREMLGPIKFRSQGIAATNEIGLATGLAWTEVGGEVLQIEATLTQGRGHITLTGKLGDVMQESAQAALTCIKARAERLGMSLDFIRKRDLHVHIPEGAIPKDGPSAGITLATAMASVLMRVPVRADIAMTGEITLRGRVLPVGGIKEKLLAAHRFGISTVIIPKDNEKDLVEVPEEVRNALNIELVETIDEVLALALESACPTEVGPTDETHHPPLWTTDAPGTQPGTPTMEG
ncbi:endopeptidase La [Pyrinomonas methylaliphatogenes]|uniref:Lon protease n=1 Tax=Pyrinomonas methylaliphatogenes TaxID=454194 RepID=A0A0B6X084_9BACT|nr:endopeptidase La [Pyrinomonas methylaliphatogenes]MBX5479830.1 endopeptidase La [Pyrinomonas methylaliphatogenes]CDM66938.1 ATP-dependent proteinase [Pyrinomonas methylaliphatogenes]